MSEDGGRTRSSGTDDTLPASTPPERSSVPTIAPPPDARYRLGDELGRGGMGRVVEAYDTHLHRTVALKEVLPKAGNIERRFQREVQITARLEHASIVPLYDAGRLADGRPFYVMRRVSGKPLDEVIARAGSLENRLALLPNVLSAIEAVAHAHRRGVVHRDLKPQNILVGELGETVVIDWGLAKVIGDSEEPVHDSLEPKLPSPADSLQTQAGSVFGTPGFMPPEQARGDELAAPADVYALGATLYQMVAGKPPFRGTSATDVISSTLRHRFEPIARAAPGAPAELVTIIEKALAFDPGLRYPDAGALAEDVRRFLTGQLVAAHRYTRRQRMARFARRHRAALVVAGLATLGIVVLAWIGVGRIVRERDAATSASIEARQQRAVAEQRTAEVRERADQLLLLYARSLLDANPTHAFAVLKQIEASTGPNREEARAIARAAVTRGVAWGVPSLPDFTTSLEMTRDGKRVLQMNRVGSLQVIDLDTRRQIATYTAPYGGMGRWVDGDRKILIDGVRGTPVLFDPTTRAVEPLALDKLASASVSADGSRVAAVTSGKELAIIDVATRQVSKLPGRSGVTDVVIAPDGTWIACGERYGDRGRRIVVVDPSGRVLAQREGQVTSMGASRGGRLMVATTDGIYEVASMANPVFTSIPVQGVDVRFVHQIVYRDERAHLVGQTAVYAWTGKAIVKLRDFLDGAMLARVVRDSALAVTSNDGRVMLMQNELAHALQVTARSGIVRIATASGSPRLVATAGDALLIWNVDDVLPRPLPLVTGAMFPAESHLASVPGLLHEWRWIDVASLSTKTYPISDLPGLPRAFDTTADDGRVMALTEHRANARMTTAYIGSPDGRNVVVDDISFELARLVEGGGLVYSPGKGRVLGKLGDEPERELVTLDSDVVGVGRNGRLGYVAISKQGELVRGQLDGSSVARTRMTDVHDNALVDGEPDGGVVVAVDSRLVRWPRSANGPQGADPALEEVARFGGRITWIKAAAVGIFVGLQGGEIMFLPAAGDHTPRRLPVGDRPTVCYDGRRAISINGHNELEVIELPTLATWTLPRLAQPSPFFTISPSGGLLYQMTGINAALWTIPEPASDFPAWLDEITNATDVDRHVHWPWQPGT